MQGRGDASGRRRVRETESGRLRSDSPECRSRNHRSQGKTRKRRKEWFCFRSRMGECWYLQSSFNFRAFPRLPWFPHLFFDFQDALRPSGEAEGRPGRSEIHASPVARRRYLGGAPELGHGSVWLPSLRRKSSRSHSSVISPRRASAGMISSQIQSTSQVGDRRAG
jgi:hypothetical protein